VIWLWLWVCFAGGIGLLIDGDLLGLVAIGAGVITLVYAATPSDSGRWLIRAGLVAIWLGGGALLWSWRVEDWAVALRIAFAALGGTALVAYLAYLLMGSPRSPRGSPR
jgi:hypothetical protein